jgi:serine/threonine protein phosphatase 1
MATYAVSDLHGCLKFYEAIKEYIQPEDKVYFLGDAGDRGPHPWETIKAIYEDEQFIYLKGNHEDMLVAAMDDRLHDMFGTGNIYLLGGNGGYGTFEDWDLEGADPVWKTRLEKLPVYAEYERPDGKKVLLSHAGFTPRKDGKLPKDSDLIWSRDHFYDPWEEDLEDVYVVHGHTPTPILDRYCYDIDEEQLSRAGAVKYSEGHKFDIDNGAVFTGYCVLFDLDTFESIVFSGGVDEIGVD